MCARLRVKEILRISFFRSHNELVSVAPRTATAPTMRLLPALLLASLQGGPSRGVASAFAPRLVTAALAPSRAGGDRTRLFGKCRRAQMGVVIARSRNPKERPYILISFFWIFLSNSFLLFSLHTQFAEPRKTQNAKRSHRGSHVRR